MKELTLEELKKIELELLVKVRNICDSNGIKYSLTFGTLLGAIRHKGFIPWDDDIDIMMPRNDYNKFIDYCQNHETGFKLFENSINKNYHSIIAKVSDNTTILLDDYTNTKSLEMGVSIDIFPIDGLGDNTYDDSIKIVKSSYAKRCVLVATVWDRFFHSVTNAWYYEAFRFVLFVFTRLLNRDRFISTFNKDIQKYSFESSNYVTFYDTLKKTPHIFERTLFENFLDVSFENEKFKVISSYDLFLKTVYGDYMKLPPENERVSRHSFKVYYK